jgi:hypothetical protein
MKKSSGQYGAMLRNPKDIHEEEVAKMRDTSDGCQGFYNPPEGHQSYYKAVTQEQNSSVSRDPSIARTELETKPQDPLAGKLELATTMQDPATDPRHRYAELNAEEISSVQPVELPANARTP